MFNNNDNLLYELGFFSSNILESMTNKNYGVFFYQRRYKWELGNIQSFLRFFRYNFNQDKLYGFPQPIHVKDHPQGYEVIDGQQRYVTTKLLILALYQVVVDKYDDNILKEDIQGNNNFIQLRNLIQKRDHNNNILFKDMLKLNNGDENKFKNFLDWFYGEEDEELLEKLQGNDFYLNYNIIYEYLSDLESVDLVNLYSKLKNSYYIFRKEEGESYELFKSINTSALPLELFEIVKAMLIKTDENDLEFKNTIISIENQLREISQERMSDLSSKNNNKVFKHILTHFLHIYYYQDTIRTMTFGSIAGHSNNDYIKTIEYVLGEGFKKDRVLFANKLNNYLSKYIEYSNYNAHIFNKANKITSKNGESLDLLRESTFPFVLYSLLEINKSDENNVKTRVNILDNILSKFVVRRYLYETKYNGFSDVNWHFYKGFYKLMGTYSNRSLEENYLYFFGNLIEKEMISDSKILDITYKDHSEIRKVLLTLDGSLINPSLEHIIPQSYDNEVDFDVFNNKLGNVFNDYFELSKSIYSLGNFMLIDLIDNKSLGSLSPIEKINKLDSMSKKPNLKDKYLTHIKDKTFSKSVIHERGEDILEELNKKEFFQWKSGNVHYEKFLAIKHGYKEEDLLIENKEDILKDILKQVSYCGNQIPLIAYNDMVDNFENGDERFLQNNEHIVKKYLKTKTSILSKYYEKLDKDEIEKFLINKIKKQMTMVQYFNKILKLNEKNNKYIIEYYVKGESGKKTFDALMDEITLYTNVLTECGPEHKMRIMGKVSF